MPHEPARIVRSASEPSGAGRICSFSAWPVRDVEQRCCSRRRERPCPYARRHVLPFSLTAIERSAQPTSEDEMKRLILATCLLAAVLAGVGAGARPARAAGLCVGSSPGCFSTLQAAVNAAHDGNTITIAAGSFAGGVTIDVSVKILGAGAAATIISGGGPVLT